MYQNLIPTFCHTFLNQISQLCNDTMMLHEQFTLTSMYVSATVYKSGEEQTETHN